MSGHPLLIRLAIWMTIFLVCLSPAGAMVGFLAGIAVAMFGGAIAVATQMVIGIFMTPPDWKGMGAGLYWGVAGLVVATIAVVLGRAWYAKSIGKRLEATRLSGRAIDILAVCACLFASMGSLQRAWP